METPKTLGNQEGVVNKKAKIIEHVRQKLERAKKRLNSFNTGAEYYKNERYNSTPGSISQRALKDGGSDLRDWKNEIGASEEEDGLKDYYASPEAGDDYENLRDLVEFLEWKLKQIKNGDENIINHFWEELQKSLK